MSSFIEAWQGEYGMWEYHVTARNPEDESKIGSGRAYYFPFNDSDEVAEAADTTVEDVYVKVKLLLGCMDEEFLNDEPVSGIVVLNAWMVAEAHRGEGVGYDMARTICNMPWPTGTVFILLPGPMREMGASEAPAAVGKLQTYWSRFGFRPLSTEKTETGLTLYGHHNSYQWPEGAAADENDD